jgi:hypothetical protein
MTNITSSVTSAPLAPVSRLLPEGKEWYTVKEAAYIIGRSTQYVRDCFDNQKLMGHAFNGRSKAGSERRRSYQIPRESLLVYLMETANYRSSDYRERVEQLLNRLPREEQKKIGERLLKPATSIWAQ